MKKASEVYGIGGEKKDKAAFVARQDTETPDERVTGKREQ